MFETYKEKLERNLRDNHINIPPMMFRPQDAANLKLSTEVKYEIATTEADFLKTCVDEGKTKSDSMIETLRVISDDKGSP